MTEYRYHRIATNQQFWQRPHAGRINSDNGYVGLNGWGADDWNFSRDVWHDGKVHLYLRAKPALADRDKNFFIALGEWREGRHWLIGFAEGVKYKISTLPKAALRRRVSELMLLERENSLGEILKGKTQKKIRDFIAAGSDLYWASVDQADLHQLPTPILLPKELTPKSDRYLLLKLDQDRYHELRYLASSLTEHSKDEDGYGLEGARIERLHSRAERDPRLVKDAKLRFIEMFGKLFCEACGFDPSKYGSRLRDRIIEVHHDVPLSTYTEARKTRIEDLRMLCPNCHRAIHALDPWMMTEQFTKYLAALK